VDLVLGTNEKFDIAGYITDFKKKKKTEVYSCPLSANDKFNHSWSAGDRTRSFLKVQDGCDYGCSYCTVPLARGESRNADIASLVAEAEGIARRGIKEIVLTGVNIGDFGKSTNESFTELIRELIKISGIERYRISSIEPNLLDDELIKMTSLNKKILPHFHIPLQSGSNRILGLMRRRYIRELFAERVSMIKMLIPPAGIGADVIAGFPGETETDFEETYSFIEQLPLTYLHIFTFSARPGTKAWDMPEKVDHQEKERRSKLLISLSESKHLGFMNQNKGHSAEVLFEKSRSNGMITGFTGNYLRVEYPWQFKLAGQIRKVTLKDISPSGRMSIEIIE
jgi:threonylcarbamoyladenosine tRNA methylthiotransferase MtaB